MRAIPGLTKEKFLNIVWSTLLMSVRSAQDSRGFSLMNSLSKLLQSLGDDFEGRKENNLISLSGCVDFVYIHPKKNQLIESMYVIK